MKHKQDNHLLNQEGIVSVAAFANREGFTLHGLTVAKLAIETLADGPELIKIPGDGWYLYTRYGRVEIIGEDA